MYQHVKLLLCALVGGSGTAYMAATNDRGLVLNGFLHFSPAGATMFYGACAAICFAFLAFAGASLVRRAALKS
jgi:hypothetical protein